MKLTLCVLHIQVKQNKRDFVLHPYKSNNSYGNQTKGNKFSVLNKSVKQLQIFLRGELLISQRKTSNASSLEPANSSWKKENREPLEGIFAFLFLDVLILKPLWV